MSNETYSDSSQGGSKVLPGEIRRLISDPSEFNFEIPDKLVIVLESHEQIDGTATVALVDGLIDVATDRDFLLPSTLTSAPYDLALWIDFTSRVLIQQIQDSPVFGFADPNTLKYVENLASVIPNSSLYDFRDKFPLAIGDFVPFYGDKIWLRRSRAMDALNLLSVPLDESETMKRFLRVMLGTHNKISIDNESIKSLKDAQILNELNIDYSRAILV